MVSQLTLTTVRTVKEAWNLLNGLVCVYKPTGVSVHHARNMMIDKLCQVISVLKINIQDPNASQLESLSEFSVTTTPNLAYHPLVNGPPIQHQDIRVSWANRLSRFSSGVLIFGINKGNRYIQELRDGRHLSVYHIGMELGLATDNQFVDGKVVEKATYAHVTPVKLDRFLSVIEASHQRKRFDYLGLHPESQTAYDLASQGLFRPAADGPTLLYQIKCIAFAPPHIMLEVCCINEDERFLANVVHELGLSLKTVAVCSQIRCIRYGFFDLQHALVKKHWTLEHLLSNVAICKDLVWKNGGFSPQAPILSPKHPPVNT
nr:EOG090X0AGI [Triops cancriformis]